MRRLTNKTVNEIFDDLDAYRSWCVEFGFVFNEADLYKSDRAWGLYNRWRNGDKSIRDNWSRDRKKIGTPTHA